MINELTHPKRYLTDQIGYDNFHIYPSTFEVRVQILLPQPVLVQIQDDNNDQVHMTNTKDKQTDSHR